MVLTATLAGSVGTGQTNSSDRMIEPAPVPAGMEEIVGKPKHQWLYTWPHDLVPDGFTGFRVVSTPVDRSVGNLGQTMGNWGRPVVLSSLASNCNVRITCTRDYPMSKDQAWMPPMDREAPHFGPTPFHGLRAGFASSPLSDPTVICYLVFRYDQTVFVIEASRTPDVIIAEKEARKVGEAIWSFNQGNQGKTPQKRP